jgi:nucleotide-binding universal stress UspA family protein
MNEGRLRLLVPLDGSPEAESVLPALMPLFRTRKFRLTLLGVGTADESSETMELYLTRLWTSLAMDGIPATTKAEWGDPADEILRTAKPEHFDLIAMATHGREGLRRELVGSVAETVLRQAEIPVLILREGAKIGDWKRMIVALDGSETAEDVLGDAAELARTMNSTLHLVRVRRPWPRLAYHPENAFPMPEEDPQPYLEGMADGLATQGILALADVREGETADEILALAKETNAGLLCLTTHGRTGLSRSLLGSVAESVLRNAPCPVLLRRAVAARAPHAASRGQ